MWHQTWKIYATLVYTQCTIGVQSLLNAKHEYEEKAKSFNTTRILKMIKKIVSEIDTKTNLCVLLHTTVMACITMQQYTNNVKGYIVHFKSRFETLKLAGG